MGTDGSENHTPLKRKLDDSVMLVSPGDSGEGLPYAPVDWPSPGDIWSWRVGKRVMMSKEVYHDRFLRAPERLQERPTKKLEFASKASLERYLRYAFPETDVNAFFAMFSWEIPAKLESNGNVVPKSGSTGKGKSLSTSQGKSKKNKGDSLSQKGGVSTGDEDVNLSITIYSAEERTPASDASAKGSGRTTRARRRISNNHANIDPDDNDYESPGDCKQGADSCLEKSQPSLTPEEFDNYLGCLSEILALPLCTDPPSANYESMNEVRQKLSSLIAMGFNDLVSSDRAKELTSLTTKLQNDPSLSPYEISILKLIQEIPFTGECFLVAKEVSIQADNFFKNLESKMASVASLKHEYNTSKEEMEAVQADEASALLNILDIDQQIANLQSRKQVLCETAKAINRKIAELSSSQKRVMDSLPKIVQEVQVANAEKSAWELKKRKAAEQEAEILAKFAPLEGFSF